MLRVSHRRTMHRQLHALLLITCLTLLFVQVVTAQTKPSDSEMKEVVRLLLEREVQRPADGGNVTVLLGPNVNSSWIPEAPGFSIRQLSYAEQKKVPEYYDLSSDFKDGVINVALTKGNYCVKAGRRYEFRRTMGTWQSKAIGYVDSETMGGDRCDGCAVGSGATYTVQHQFPDQPASTKAELRRPGDIRLTGSVKKISCSKDEQSYVRCKVELNLDFTNTGSTPLIILQPQGEYQFWHGATSLALSEKESLANSLVYVRSGWPSFYKTPMYEKLANLLDQSLPPTGTTLLLLPGITWSWDTSISLDLQEGNSCGQAVGVEIGWDEIKRRVAPLWMRVSYEMWPFNVEHFKPDLGGILKKRWQRDGLLYLEEKRGNFWQATLTSDPIELPLHKIDLATNQNQD